MVPSILRVLARLLLGLAGAAIRLAMATPGPGLLRPAAMASRTVTAMRPVLAFLAEIRVAVASDYRPPYAYYFEVLDVR